MPRDGQVCWNLYARGIDAATAAHIHRGAAGGAGPPVRDPDHARRRRPQPGLRDRRPRLAREIAMRGHEFYVNVHTAAHPAGAIRGQLRGGRRCRAAPGRRPASAGASRGFALAGRLPGWPRPRLGLGARLRRGSSLAGAASRRGLRALLEALRGSGARLRARRRGRSRRDRARRGRPSRRGTARARPAVGGRRLRSSSASAASRQPGQREIAHGGRSASFIAFFACLRTFFGTFTPPTRFGI